MEITTEIRDYVRGVYGSGSAARGFLRAVEQIQVPGVLDEFASGGGHGDAEATGPQPDAPIKVHVAEWDGPAEMTADHVIETGVALVAIGTAVKLEWLS